MALPPPPVLEGSLSVHHVALAPDGSAWSLVSAAASGPENVVLGRTAVVRHDPDGELDASLGGDGAVEVTDNLVYRLVAAPDGTLILVSAQRRPVGNEQYDVVVQRVGLDGTVSELGRYGPIAAEFDFSLNYRFWLEDAVLDASGRLTVAVGRMTQLIVRFLPDGSVDPSLNGGAPLPAGTDLVTVGDDLVAVRVGPALNAPPDLLWVDADGTTTTATPPAPAAVAAGPDGTGRVIVATSGPAPDGATLVSSLLAYGPGAQLDPSYGDGGQATLPAALGSNHETSALVALGAGRLGVFDRRAPAGAIAVDASGTVDPTWAGDGRLDLSGDAASSPPFATWAGPLSADGAGRVAALTLGPPAGGSDDPHRLVWYDGSTGTVTGDEGDGRYAPLGVHPDVQPRAVFADDTGFTVFERWGRGNRITGRALRRVGLDGVLDPSVGGGMIPVAGVDRKVVATTTGWMVLLEQGSGSASPAYLVALRADGSLDTDGWGTATPGRVDLAANQNVTTLAADDDGSVVVASLGGGSGAWIRRIAAPGTVTVDRALPDLPPATGNDDFTRPALTIDPAGRVLLAVRACTSLTSGTCTTLVRRFLPDLTDDLSFGSGGTVAVPDIGSSAYERIDVLAVGADGSITLSGASGFQTRVVRLTDSGTLDPAYGTGGVVRTYATFTAAATVDGAGRVILAGTDVFARGRAEVVRLDATGALDERFAAGGSRVFDADEAEIWTAVDVAPSGRIALVGERAPAEAAVVYLLGGDGPAPAASAEG